MDWIPVDILSNILVELSGVGESRPPVHEASEPHINGIRNVEVEPISTIPVYHAVNPEECEWADLVPTIQRHLGASVRIVTWSEWVAALSQSQHQDSAMSLRENPGLKLLDFFVSLQSDAALPPLETERSTMRSGTLAGLKPVGEEWMEIWLKQWGL